MKKLTVKQRWAALNAISRGVDEWETEKEHLLQYGEVLPDELDDFDKKALDQLTTDIQLANEAYIIIQSS